MKNILVLYFENNTEKAKEILSEMYDKRPLTFDIFIAGNNSIYKVNELKESIGTDFDEIKVCPSENFLSSLENPLHTNCLFINLDKDNLVSADDIYSAFELNPEFQNAFAEIKNEMQDCFCGIADMIELKSADNNAVINMESAVTAFAEGRLGFRALLRCISACVKYRFNR